VHTAHSTPYRSLIEDKSELRMQLKFGKLVGGFDNYAVQKIGEWKIMMSRSLGNWFEVFIIMPYRRLENGRYFGGSENDVQSLDNVEIGRWY